MTVPSASATVAGPPGPGTAACIRLGHARPLDGLRGLAVLAVLGAHLDWPWCQGGYFGVDMFFTLSGFLITTLLLEEQARSGEISLRKFFWRRFLRLYPALVVLISFSTLSAVTRPDVSIDRVWLVAASNLLYFSNWLISTDTHAWVGGTAHTWSLAVEVHFYLVWAILLTAITRRWGIATGPLLALALGLALASATWRIAIWSSGAAPSRMYVGTDTRFDAVFLGVAAAMLRWRWLHPRGDAPSPMIWSRSRVRGVELGAAALLGWALATIPTESPFQYLGGFALAGGATAVLILASLLSPHSLLAPLLQTSALVWVGQVSYSLYLWQQPVIKLLSDERLARHGVTGWTADAVRLLIATAIAAASYYGIERTFLRLRQKARA